MHFQWDPAKAAANQLKHGGHLADATGVFENPHALTREAAYPAEARFVTIGRDLLERVLVVAWTWDSDDIRLISARNATTGERRQYAQDADA